MIDSMTLDLHGNSGSAVPQNIVQLSEVTGQATNNSARSDEASLQFNTNQWHGAESTPKYQHKKAVTRSPLTPSLDAPSPITDVKPVGRSALSVNKSLLTVHGPERDKTERYHQKQLGRPARYKLKTMQVA